VVTPLVELPSRSACPRKSLLEVAVEVPHSYAGVRGADDLACPLSMRVERSVAQNAPDEAGSFFLADCECHEAIGAVAIHRIIETNISREERRLVEPLQEGNDRLVQHSRARNFAAHLDNSDPPAPQKLALAVRDVFIENDHDPVIRV